MSHHSWLRGRTVVYNPPVKPVEIRNEVPPSATGFLSRIVAFVRRVLGFFWRLFKRTSFIVGAPIVLLILFTIFGAWNGQESPSLSPTIPDSVILSYSLDGRLPETDGMSQIMSLLQRDAAPLTAEDVVDAIDAAAKDSRVRGLVFKVSGGGYDVSQLQVLRSAVLRFKAAGKKTAIYSESYGDAGYGLGLYYFASAFDKIWMQPAGLVSIGGVAMEAPYFKGLTDMVGVQAQFYQRKEYKNAMEHLTSDRMGDASREEMQSIVTDLAEQLIKGIKKSRDSQVGRFDSLLRRGMITDDVALKEKLIDVLDYEDVMLDKTKKEIAAKSYLSLSAYYNSLKTKKMEADLLKEKAPGVTVAVIPVNGMIVDGSGGAASSGMVGADDIVGAVEEAEKDTAVKAIVLRINSPGGTPSASESIHRAVVRAQTVYKKPVMVSMGTVAASGGYWIAAPANKIYVTEATLTGSIGVVGGKVNIKGLSEKLHVRWDKVSYGENAGMFSPASPFSESERIQFEAALDNAYAYFIKRVSDGRHMTPEQVEKIAKGRVYTGRQAVANGLADEIGGPDKVLDDIAKQNGLKSRDGLTVVYLPQNVDPMNILYQFVSRRIGLSPFFEKLTAAFAPFGLTAKARGAGVRLAYDGTIPDAMW